jgi:hypothetical protein
LGLGATVVKPFHFSEVIQAKEVKFNAAAFMVESFIDERN